MQNVHSESYLDINQKGTRTSTNTQIYIQSTMITSVIIIAFVAMVVTSSSHVTAAIDPSPGLLAAASSDNDISVAGE